MSHPNAHQIQFIGGDKVKLLGGIDPPIPRVSAPLVASSSVDYYHSRLRIAYTCDTKKIKILSLGDAMRQ